MTSDLSNLRKYFDVIDPKAKIWGIGEKPSPYLAGTIDFEGSDIGISVIDQFLGKQPLLMNRDTLRKETEVAFLPTVILDSNVVSYLHEYRTKDNFRNSNSGKIVRKLLEKFIEIGCDYNPVFYFTESAAKNDEATLKSYALEMATTMFALHSMDEQHFLQTDEITPNPDAVAHYLKHFGVKDASEIPEAFLNKTILSPNRPDLKNTCDEIYAVLLKMILIHLTSQSTVPGKLEQLKEFFDNELGYQMAREFLIAADYFSGNCDKFLSLKPGSKWEKQKPKIMASAWDILLLRVPELLLASGDQNEAPLGYVCTAETALRAIGKLFSIKAISCMPPDVTVPMPVIEYNFARIEEKLGAAVTAKIQELVPTLLGMPSSLSKKASHKKAALPTIIASLEQQVRMLCK